MSKFAPLALTVAAAIILSGCQAAAPTLRIVPSKTLASAAKTPAAKSAVLPLKPTVTMRASTNTVAAPDEAADDADATASEDTIGSDLEAYDAAATAAGGYGLMAVKGGVKASGLGLVWGKLTANLRAKLAERNQKADGNLAAWAKAHPARAAVVAAFRKAPWVDNGDGTKTKSVNFDAVVTLNDKSRERHVRASVTVDATTNVLVSAHAELRQALRNGATLDATRDKVLQADGSYVVTFHSAAKFKDGVKRTTDWTRTIGVNGTESGHGATVWTNAQGAELRRVERSMNAKGSTQGLPAGDGPTDDAGGADDPAAVDPEAPAPAEDEAAAIAG